MPRPIHFELPADDPDRAAKFYTNVFGWQISKWGGPEEYWIINTGDEGVGINGGLMRRRNPGGGTVNTIGVESLDDTVSAIESAGGKVVAPRMTIPTIGYIAYCQDPEGNMFGVLQPDSSAK